MVNQFSEQTTAHGYSPRVRIYVNLSRTKDLCTIQNTSCSHRIARRAGYQRARTRVFDQAPDFDKIFYWSSSQQ